ncbi:MAG: hypothetical protein GY747_01225 [Planctomycetes bacterium]|nr:hypothetical protein [Planctomycetota bacterium]MCP4769850.1 hypothetical protein [Planctomycetota bacterium]MCP4859690.1 hypothetical protein [Planctomycetota bacterium]
MKFILPLLSTALFLSCAAQPKFKDITLEGAAADTAFHEWSAALPAEFTYPVEYRFDMSVGMQGISGLEDQEAVFKLGSDTSMVSSWEYRTQSKISIEVMGQEIAINIGAESNAEELRISLDNMEFIAMQLGVDLPSGVSLSTVRVEKLWDVIMRLTEISFETLDGFEDVATFTESLTGFGDFAHPMLNSRYLSMSPMLSAGRWQIEGEQVHVRFDLNQDLFLEMMTDPALAELGVDLNAVAQTAKEMEMNSIFNVYDGTMTSMTVNASFNAEDEFGDPVPISVAMRFENSPLLEPVAPIEFSDPSTAMDLNVYFDEYWPMVEGMMPMIESMMRQEMGNASSDGGEDFEF